MIFFFFFYCEEKNKKDLRTHIALKGSNMPPLFGRGSYFVLTICLGQMLM